MEHLRVFLDHLYFSIICVGVGLIVLSRDSIRDRCRVSHQQSSPVHGYNLRRSVLRVGLFFHKSDYQKQSSAAHYPHGRQY